MKNGIATLVSCFITSVLIGQALDVTLRFNAPAINFTESIPLGNGRVGAMVFGNTHTERIALNEISLWSGGPQNADLDSAYLYLKPIQNLLLQKKNKEAQALLMKNFVAKGKGSGYGRGANEKYGSYQTIGDLQISWSNAQDSATQYSRELDLETATSVTSFKRNGSLIREEVFTDFNNDVIWLRLSSSQPRQLSFSIAYYRKENLKQNNVSNKQIVAYGQLPSGQQPGMQYATLIKLMSCDGKILYNDTNIVITQATECVVAIAMRTNYNYATGALDKKDVVEQAGKDLLLLKAKTFAAAKAQSISTYKKAFNACRWHMPSVTEATQSMSTFERLEQLAKGKIDNQLPVLYFNYGRYLLISSSRKGLLPANLQGLWAVEYQAPWNCDYHLNINIQMNYWLAEPLNMPQQALPLFQYTKNLVPNGELTAQKYYGAGGWVAHVISNPWFYTSPGEGANWGSTLTGGAWLATHMWEHYAFTQDKAFLKQYYPVLKGSALFLKNILIEEPEHGWLVTAPSNSPENAYVMPNGFIGNTCMGPTIDKQICRNIFNACIDASEILNIDKPFAQELLDLRNKLAPNQVSKIDGGMQEWLHDWPAEDPHHRHISQLYGLHPYDEITPWETPQLVEAAKKTLERRGDDGTGWSKAWKICFWARMGDGDHALKLLDSLFSPIGASVQRGHFSGGTYPNLFDAHPPFQIDGNFGATAGIAEMLLQSHGKQQVIRFLPALPSTPQWASGKVTGMVARGNYLVDMSWEKGRLTTATVTPRFSSLCSIYLPVGKSVYTSKGFPVSYDYNTSTKVATLHVKAFEKIIIR